MRLSDSWFPGDRDGNGQEWAPGGMLSDRNRTGIFARRAEARDFPVREEAVIYTKPNTGWGRGPKSNQRLELCYQALTA